jgi:DNA-binding MarR family transcriptional regulator
MFELDRTLTYRLHLLHKLTDVASQRAYVAGAGLSMSVGRCLTAVGSFAPLSVNDLAQKANLTKGQASRAAQSLVDQGLVLKNASLTDGRGVVLTLTAKGEVAWRSAMQVVERRNDEIFAVLSEAERAQLSILFDRLLTQARASCAGVESTAASAASDE